MKNCVIVKPYTVPCAAAIERTQLVVIPSHNRIAPSLDAATYMEPVQ